MVILLILGVILVGAAVALGARAVAFDRIRAAERIDRIGSYGFQGSAEDEEEEQESASIFNRAAELIGGTLTVAMREDEEEELRAKLLSAGLYGTSTRRFAGYRALGGLALLGLWLWLGTLAGASPALLIVGLSASALLGWRLPQLILEDRAQKRLATIDYDLPEFIDSLIVTVEAGMGFTGSMRIAAAELEGPLADEIGLALQEQQLGLSIEAALGNTLRRADTPSMRSFVRSVAQGGTLGVSLGGMLRGLATEMRSRRRAAAEERAHTAPVKILFPLVFLIFPSIFIVLLYPGLHNLNNTLGG
jgi:tight adherence protein C